MPFGIPSEYFHGGFGIPDKDEYTPEESKHRIDEISQESCLTQALIDSGVTWNPRGVARELLSRGVRITITKEEQK